MKYTKIELSKWIVETIRHDGCQVPYVINGGGFGRMDEDTLAAWEREEGVDLEELDSFDFFGDDYYDDIEVVSDEEQLGDFMGSMTKEELEAVTFVRVSHATGYNEENFDYIVATWDFVE